MDLLWISSCSRTQPTLLLSAQEHNPLSESVENWVGIWWFSRSSINKSVLDLLSFTRDFEVSFYLYTNKLIWWNLLCLVDEKVQKMDEKVQKFGWWEEDLGIWLSKKKKKLGIWIWNLGIFLSIKLETVSYWSSLLGWVISKLGPIGKSKFILRQIHPF